MKNSLLLVCFSIFLLPSAFAQNRTEFFKAIPSKNTNIPQWASMMYSENPNVQEVENAYLEYYKNEPFKKNIHTQNYKYWRRKIASYVTQDGYILVPDKATEDAKIKSINAVRKMNSRNAGTWQNLGPLETYDEGGVLPISFQVNVYCVDQSKTNKDILFAGTEGAGIYRTNDKGLTWELCSAETEVTSVEAVQIHPRNPNIVFAAGNRRIFRTTDGGDQWVEVNFIDASGYAFRFNPENPDEIFCAASNGLYQSKDGGDSWNRKFTETCWDIIYHATDSKILYLLKNINGQAASGLWKSSNGGETWLQITQGWYQPEDPGTSVEHGGKLGVTIADPDRVYAALIGDSKEGDSGWIGIYMSEDNGESWKLSPNQIGGPYNEPNITPWNVAAYSDGYHQGYYNFGLGVSSVNPNKLWVGTIRLSESSDAGKTFTAIGAANSIKHHKIHADIQAILVQDNEIWIASDGGLDYSNNELTTHESRKYGITGADFWGFGSGWNEDVLVGGKYHNGNGVYYQTYGHGNFLHIGGVEEATGYVNPLDNRTVYTNQYWANRTRAQRVPELISGAILDVPHFSLIPNETYIESSSSGIYFDPRYSRHLYIGSGDGVWKSFDGGVSFKKLMTFDNSTVHEIAISRSNPDVLYCVVHTGGFWDGCSIYRSEDAGSTWTKTTNITGDRWRLEIDVHPENPMEIWVASSRGNNGGKVYQSLNGGQNWSNKTTSILNDQRMKDLIVQGGTENTIYLATDRGIFYYENNQWQPYSIDLPYALNSLSLRPFYRDNKLRLATYGRGIYETELAADFKPIAQAMTLSDSILCTRDTIPFDCYSVLNHEDATWTWEFSPEPLYISSKTSRNPKVVFGTQGNYAVSLTVTDKLGRSSTYFNPEMIKVFNQCTAEGIAGTSIELLGDGDYFQTSSLNTRTNQFTVTAWVHPNGIQQEYSAIFMNDEETAGLNFTGNNNTLGYHWPNGAWWWNSGLQVPANEWSYVAMVVEPDGVTVYVNGKGSKHSFTVPQAFLQAVKIGSYKAWGGRNMRGNIDEVCVWNRALSEEEIRLQRHLTKENLITEDTAIIAYYQFNEPGSSVFDRKNSFHGFLAGNAGKSNRSVAVGSGNSQILIYSDNNSWTAEELGLNLETDAFSASQIDKLAGSKIKGLNCTSEDGVEDYPVYVFNHYESFLDVEAANILFTDDSYVDGQIPKMYYRPENSGDAPWVELKEGTSSGNSWTFELVDFEFLTGQYCLLSGEPTTSTSNSQKNENVRVFPNPVITGQELFIRLAGSENGTFSVYDMSGKIQFKQKIEGGKEHVISLKTLAPGNYMYNFKSNQNIANGVIQVME